MISYFVDHSREQPTTCIEILRALVKQILCLHGPVSKNVSRDLESSVKVVFPSAQARPSAKAITRLILDCMSKTGSCSFIIDGIDALPEKEVYEFLDALHELFPSELNEGHPHRLFMSCRQSLGRGIQLESIPSSAYYEIRLDDIKHDLLKFVDHAIDTKQRRRSITRDTHLIEEMKRILKAHCGKM